jgi:7-keto-8-aminopelargonate synthetase-like enzyme
VLAALRDGLRRYGLNVAASRLTTGNHALYEELEFELARFFRFPSAVLVSCGYLADLVAAQALAGRCSHVLLDERAHTSLRDAAPVLGCPVKTFRHRDARDLARLARWCGPKARPLVLTDGLFAYDGSVAPLNEYLAAMPPEGLLLVDDAHGAGTLGAHGRGTAECVKAPTGRLVQTISLAKAFGAFGGAVLGPEWLRRKILSASRMFIGHTPPPLPLVSAALKSIDILRKEPALLRRLGENAEFVKSRLREAGLRAPPENPGPIVTMAPPSAAAVSRLKKALLARGVYPSFIRYPGGPAHGYFRFAISSEHSREQLERLVAALSGEFKA